VGNPRNEPRDDTVQTSHRESALVTDKATHHDEEKDGTHEVDNLETDFPIRSYSLANLLLSCSPFSRCLSSTRMT